MHIQAHSLSLLSLNRRHDLPRVLTRPKLTIINPLPRSRVQLPIRNRHTNTRPHQTTLNMRWHIIQPLRIMPVQLTLPVLRRNSIQRIRHVRAHVFVVIFVQAKGAGCVLNEEVQNADFVVFELRELAHDFIGDEVATTGFGGEGELFLGEGHACDCWCARGWRAAGAGWETGGW
jgi:hypothetical protein